MKLSKSYLPFLLLFISIQFISWMDSPPFSRTGAPGEALCSQCHSPNNGNGNIYICVTSSGPSDCIGGLNCDFPTTIEPNTTYSIQVLLENCSAGKVKAGFELVALDGNENTSASIGTFSNLGTNVEATSPNGQFANRVYLKHSNGAKSFSTNLITYTADWTSPSTINGPTYFYAAGVIANGDNDTAGDLVKSTSITTGPLPVKLTYFQAEQSDKQEATITWETATENRSDYFEVLRSPNGKDYETLEKIPAAGFSTQSISYSYIDKNPLLNKTVFYRLKQVDLDGKFVYSSAQTLEVLDFIKNEMNILPNPVGKDGCIFVDFLATKNYPNAAIQVFDTMGRKIVDLKTKMPNGLKEGMNKMIVDTANLPTGVYFLNIHNGQKMLTNQTVIVK